MKALFDPDKAARASARQQSFDDLQNEVADRETGRQRRFLPAADERSPNGERKRQEAGQAYQSMLEVLMADPVYRARYDGVMNRLRDAEQATEAALDRISRMMDETEDAIEDMEDRAARLPDGAMVFADASGTVRRADGSIVPDHLVDTILWTGNEPSYEDYNAQQGRLADLEEARTEVEQYRDDVLGPARDRMADDDNPPSLDELDEIMDDIEANMPAIVREEVAPSPPADQPGVETSQIAVPTLSLGQ